MNLARLRAASVNDGDHGSRLGRTGTGGTYPSLGPACSSLQVASDSEAQLSHRDESGPGLTEFESRSFGLVTSLSHESGPEL